MGAFHTVALNLQQKGARWSPVFRKLNHVVDVFLRKQRHAGSDAANYRNSIARRPARRRWNRQGPGLEPLFLEKPFPFQRRNVVLYGRRVDSEMPPDLTDRWRKPVVFDVIVDEVQNRLLPSGKHGPFLYPNIIKVIKVDLKTDAIRNLRRYRPRSGGIRWKETAASL